MDEKNEKIMVDEKDYVAIKSLSKGCQIIGMTRGNETKIHHTENLDKGEVALIQFTNKTSAIKIKGNAEIYTKFGIIKSTKEE